MNTFVSFFFKMLYSSSGDIDMYNHKKIIILGMARSGYEVAKLLSSYENDIIITDRKDQEKEKIEELKKLGVNFIIKENQEELVDETVDILIKNPGIRKDHPAVLKAHFLSIPVVNELEVAHTFLPKDVTIIGVTGSNGKTTVTTMLYETLKMAGFPVYLAGNIGVPLSLTVQSMKEGSYLVAEISDHQLLDMYDFKTNVSILTNLSPVHLDFHGTYENYKSAKKKIFSHHTEKDIAILNMDNMDVMNMRKDILSSVFTFSSTQKADAYIEDDCICMNGKKVLAFSDIVLKGKHNYENIMCVLLTLSFLGCDVSFFHKYLKTFHGVEHRMEYIGKVDGVSYYNDAKSTNTDSTITALSSFQNDILLLLGGLDRGHSFDPLLPYMNHVKEIICFGETRKRIEDWARYHHICVSSCVTLREAMIKARQVARTGDTVLLSPACASWDQYEKFEDRGEEFKKLVASFEDGKGCLS